jgi:hypothetical protein
MDGFKKAGNVFDKSLFKRRPTYSVVLHQVRKKFGLAVNTYLVIDSIHKLTSTDYRYPECIMSKEDMADFLDISRATVFRCINEAEKNDLIERTERGGLRATRKWIDAVEVYTIKKR